MVLLEIAIQTSKIVKRCETKIFCIKTNTQEIIIHRIKGIHKFVDSVILGCSGCNPLN